MTFTEKLKKALRLFADFIQFGVFTFGGGWSIIAQMQRRYVEKEKRLTPEELLDLTSLGRSLPGTMVGNVAMLYGYRECGVLGGVACIFGIALPPLVILSIITVFYSAFRDNEWVAAAMSGVRAAVVPIIFSAAVGLLKGTFKFPPCVAVFVITLVLYLAFGLSCVYLVIIGAVCGLIISEIYERRGKSERK